MRPCIAACRFAADQDFKLKPLSVLNSEALAHLRDGDDARSIAAFAKLFCKLRENNLTHKELYVVHSNRALAYLNLGLYEEALWDARRCATLAEAQFSRNHERSAVPSYIKSFVRKARPSRGGAYAQLAALLPGAPVPALTLQMQAAALHGAADPLALRALLAGLRADGDADGTPC